MPAGATCWSTRRLFLRYICLFCNKALASSQAEGAARCSSWNPLVPAAWISPRDPHIYFTLLQLQSLHAQWSKNSSLSPTQKLPCFWMSLGLFTITPVLSAVQMKWWIINFTTDRLAWEAAGSVESAFCWNLCTDKLTGHLEYQSQLVWTLAYCSSPYLSVSMQMDRFFSWQEPSQINNLMRWEKGKEEEAWT